MTKFSFYPVDRANALEQWAAEYSFTQTEPTPWTPLAKDLKDCRAALITSSGLRLNSQPAFAVDKQKGSVEFREVSTFANRTDFVFDLPALDRREAAQDINVLLPIDRFKELVETRTIGDLSETFFSFVGTCHDLAALNESASAVAERLHAGEVHVAFLFPVDLWCNQTLGFVARELERRGISTVCLVTVKEIAQQIKIPRALFINFPFGRTLGRAHAVPIQQSIVHDMVHAVKSLERPGKLIELPYKWEGMIDG